MKNTIIDTFGHITKVEKLHTLATPILENTFVLENFEPFPGYHGANLPSGFDPYHLFLVTRNYFNYEEVSRISMRIHRNCNVSFGARPAELFIFNKVLPAIRIKNLKSYEAIPEIQKWFIDEGVFFMKKRKYDNMGMIKVMKHFNMSEIEEGLYKDLDNPLMFYIEMPTRLSWKLFEKATYSIKNNLDNNNFDAAQGVIYLKDVLDVVRVYKKGMNVDFLKSLRKYYLEEIRKIRL